MEKPNFLFYNGQLMKSGKPIFDADNRSFRYGDGFFETMKWKKGKIQFAEAHFERCFETLHLLGFDKPAHFTPDYLQASIEALIKKNAHASLSRIRLTIFRGDGGLQDPINHYPAHLLQSWPLNPAMEAFNSNGLILGVYEMAKKGADQFSKLKTNNFLGYAMAAIWAKKEKWNDAILLNHQGNVVDATIANLFMVKDGIVYTPALSEGPIAGVMRRNLLTKLRAENIPVEETAISLEDLFSAQEVFLTNVIFGIKWVKQIGEAHYQPQLSKYLHDKISQG